MLYWYSGTGNSRLIAQRIASLTEESDCRFMPAQLGIIAERNILPQPAGIDSINATLGFCFPVYSWGVPPVVMKLIEILDSETLAAGYVYAVLTCGDEAGLAAEMLRNALARRGITLHAVFTVIMPNNYVMLPGFGIDSKELEAKKLREADARIAAVAAAINARRVTTNVHRGPMAWPKTHLIYPLFRRWGVQTSRWKVDASKCTGCGRCAGVCPSGNIRLNDDGTPHWGKHCFSCTACYHACPARAIDYGSFTRGKGQYKGPKRH